VGSTTTAKVFKDSGRALMSVDGKYRVAGFRRRHHMQGHRHTTFPNDFGNSTFTGKGVNANQITVHTGDPVTDTVNGTPITGPETEPNSSTVYRYIWAQIYIP
jgi:hypothetical protein